MQAITDDLAALLLSKFQAGASGFRGKIITGGQTLYPTTISVDHSLQTPASQLTADFTNEAGEVALASGVLVSNALIQAWQWYGDEANAIQTFEGFIDKIAEHRDPRGVAVTCRDWVKPLIVQDMATIAPQGADEDGAVRTTANLVYLNMEISDIVSDLLDKAGYPATKRAIQPTGIVLDEYLGRDGSSYIDAIGELADIPAFNAFADEIAFFRFQADGKLDAPVEAGESPTPVYTFTAGVDIVSLDPQQDDYDTKTRVKATGPYTTLQDAWTELWHSNALTYPVGIRYDPGDPTHLFVADRYNARIYKILQSDRSIVSSVASGITPYHLNGISGDPDDDTVYWTLDSPWWTTGSFAGQKVRKHLIADNSVLATFNLANQQWTDIKVGATGIWLANFTTDKFHLLDKGDGSQIASYTITYLGVPQTNPVGVAIDGDDLYLAFYTQARWLKSTVGAPSTITRVLKMAGAKNLEGDIDTTTHTELYANSGDLGLFYKFTLKVPVTTDVSVEVVNEELEAALGVELDTGVQIRRLVLNLKQITSYAMATEIAYRHLDKVDQFRNLTDFGCIGNPALQKGDLIRIVDPVTEIADDFQVDTYRTAMGDTYLGVIAAVPWISSYAGPGRDPASALQIIETGPDWKIALTGSPPGGWKDPGFDDSAYANAISVTEGGSGHWVDWGSSRWIWEDEATGTPRIQPSGEERSFRRQFTLASIPTIASLDVTADNGCLVYLNGTLIADINSAERGAVDTVHSFTFITTVTVDRSLFVIGANCLSIIGWNETAAPNAGPAAVYAALTVQ